MNVSGAYSLIIGEESHTIKQSSKPSLYQSGVLYLQLVTLQLERPISNIIHNIIVQIWTYIDPSLDNSQICIQPKPSNTITSKKVKQHSQ